MGFVWNRTRQSPLLVLSRHIASRHDLPGLAVCHAEDIHALSGCMSLRAVQTTDSLLAACVTVWRGMDSDCATDSDYHAETTPWGYRLVCIERFFLDIECHIFY